MPVAPADAQQPSGASNPPLSVPASAATVAAPPPTGEALVAHPPTPGPANAPSAQASGYPPAPDVHDTWRPRNSNLLYAGALTLVGTYTFTALVGLELMAKANQPGETCTNCDVVGPALLIPVAGPWVALGDSNPNGGKAVSAILGVAQATGVILTVAGLVVYSASGQPHTAHGLERWRNLQIMPTQGGVYAGVALDL